MTLRPVDEQQQQASGGSTLNCALPSAQDTLASSPPPPSGDQETSSTANREDEPCPTMAKNLQTNNHHATALLTSSSTNCCRICLDDDPHGLYSPCRCRGSIKFVHSHCLTRWRKSLMVHGRDESANACTMCGFKFVLKKRARLHDLISYRGVRILITFLVVLAMMFPAGYIMKACVILSVYNDQPFEHRQSLWSFSSNMDEMNIFPICKAGSGSTLPSAAPAPTPLLSALVTTGWSTCPSTNHISLFPGEYAHRHCYSSPSWQGSQCQEETPISDQKAASSIPDQLLQHHKQEEQYQQQQRKKDNPPPPLPSWWRFKLSSKIDLRTLDYTLSILSGSWAWVLAGVDVVGSSTVAHWVKYPFVDDRLWHLLLCRMHHLHLGFFFLGSASNVYMACKMLSDMYDLILSPPHSRPVIKQLFLTLCSVFVLWFWFTYNLMAFRVSATEEEFMAELPLWTLRWINVGVAIVDLSYRRVYRRLGKWKIEEELLDISEVEKLEQMQLSIFQLQLYDQVRQGQYLLDQFRQLGEHMNSQSLLHGYATAVEAVSEAVATAEAYAKTASIMSPFHEALSSSSSSSSVSPSSLSSLSSAAAASMISTTTQALAPLYESSFQTFTSAFGVRRSSVTDATTETATSIGHSPTEEESHSGSSN
ncbi:hypothetical protein BGW42_005315 [Actinomortierella wolfii]|nr:hypothetical protein BGW42_005315 [Actinomortierella wolfii]